jgi:hypothetical protein
MVIWTRLGILGLLIPTALIVLAMFGAEALAKQQARGEDRKPAKKAPGADGAEETPPDDSEEAKAAEQKRADDERKRAAERERALKRANNTGYLIGGFASAVVLWPLGRWMNKSESEGSGEAQVSGGHTMFFIPLEYWGLIWAVIGLAKFAGRT